LYDFMEIDKKDNIASDQRSWMISKKSLKKNAKIH
jgi:hypothetical protein